MQAHERFQRDTVPCLGNRRTNRELSIHFHLGIHKEVQRPDDGTASLHVSVDVVIAVGMPFAVPMEKVIGFPSAAGEEQIVPPRIVPHDARQRAIEVGIDDPTFRRSDSLQSIVTAVERNSSGLSVHSAKSLPPVRPERRWPQSSARRLRRFFSRWTGESKSPAPSLPPPEIHRKSAATFCKVTALSGGVKWTRTIDLHDVNVTL